MKNGIARKRSERLMLLLKPRNMCNSDSIARSIALCRWAKEVSITTGEFGFMVDMKSGAGVRETVKKDIARLAKGSRVYEISMHSTYSRT